MNPTFEEFYVEPARRGPWDSVTEDSVLTSNFPNFFVFFFRIKSSKLCSGILGFSEIEWIGRRKGRSKGCRITRSRRGTSGKSGKKKELVLNVLLICIFSGCQEIKMTMT